MRAAVVLTYFGRMVHPVLRPLLPQLGQLCARYGVQQLYLFGSAVTARFDPARSDVDAVVQMPPDLDPLDRGARLWALWEALEELFGRRVDLLTPESLRNPIFKLELAETQELIYDATHSQIAV